MVFKAKISKTGGFTLLEMIVVMAVWMVILAFASRLLWYTSDRSARLHKRQEALESARVAVDALTTNIQMANSIELRTDPDGMLRRIELRQTNPQGQVHWFDFRYNRDALPGAAAYKRLVFGGNNELASHLNEVRLVLSADRSLIYITVTTDEILGEPITLTGTVDIRYKDLTIR